MGRSVLGSEPTLFYLKGPVCALSYLNLGVVPKGQDITKKKLRLESGKLRAVLFLECVVCFCLSTDRSLCQIGPGVARGLAGAFLAGGCALEGQGKASGRGILFVLDWEWFAAKT